MTQNQIVFFQSDIFIDSKLPSLLRTQLVSDTLTILQSFQNELIKLRVSNHFNYFRALFRNIFQLSSFSLRKDYQKFQRGKCKGFIFKSINFCLVKFRIKIIFSIILIICFKHHDVENVLLLDMDILVHAYIHTFIYTV